MVFVTNSSDGIYIIYYMITTLSLHVRCACDAVRAYTLPCSRTSWDATQFILTTDEDRDHVDASITRESIETALSELLNVTVNRGFSTSGGATTLISV